MILTTFASGSSGNCSLLQGGGACVLLDAGISMRRIRCALARQSLTPDDLDGILITHEHSDHIAALPMLCRHCHPRIYAPLTVAHALERSVPNVESFLQIIQPFEPFSIKKLTITAFSTPHDTPQSVGYILEAESRLGYCTDTGCITDAMRDSLRGVPCAVIEANHDLAMLRYGPYPVPLKRRILADTGHLSNEACGELACYLAEHGARSLVLGHLSRENNRPQLAFDTVRTALDAGGFSNVTLQVAPMGEDLQVEVPTC